MIKYIFFDVSGTLLGKPSLYLNIQNALLDFGFNIAISEIEYKHKILSEVVYFPDRTDEFFYNKFNSDLLFSLGVIPTAELLSKVFENCTYLPWKEFEDTKVLLELSLPLGIISNFNSTLNEKINSFFGQIFSDILVSEELGVAKPQIEFYERALKRIPFKAEEVLYVGDSIKLDIQPAQSVGMNTLLIDRLGLFENSSICRIQSLLEIKKYIQNKS